MVSSNLGGNAVSDKGGNKRMDTDRPDAWEPTLIKAACCIDDLALMSGAERKKRLFNRNKVRPMYPEIIHMSRHDNCAAGL